MPIDSFGLFDVTGGYTSFEAGGTNNSSYGVIALGGAYLNAPAKNATGLLRVSGGSFVTIRSKGIKLIDPNGDPNDPNNQDP